MNKTYLNSIHSLGETLKESSLCDIGIDGSEILIDSVISDGVLKDIPIVSTLVGLIKSSSSISSMLLLKKIIYFLNGIKDISPEKRSEMIASIDKSPKYKTKIGEKLLYIINRCDDHDKASLVAELFKAFLNKEIEYDDFLQGSYILNSIYIDDFVFFLNLDENNLCIEDAMLFLNLGLCSISLNSPKLTFHQQLDWDESPDHYSLEEVAPECEITDFGKKFRSVYQNS